MNQIVTTTTNGSAGASPSLLVPRVDFSVRLATLADIPFMDSMQKKFGKQLGYFPTKQFEGYVEMGAVLVAVDGVGDAVGSGVGDPAYRSGRPIGYVISRDRYLKRDELGVIYQLCVAPGTQRKLVGASLIAEVFRRSAYGCKLYCCWCAQDIDANYFWESIGFVPIAFRAGGKQKANPSTGLRTGRVHIFWQRRVHQDDLTTPWWYPCATNGGAIRADRLVFPIPPGVHWKDVAAVVVPEQRRSEFGLRRAQSSRVRGSGEENAIVVSRKPTPKKSASGEVSQKTLGGWGFAPAEPLKTEKVKREKPLDNAPIGSEPQGRRRDRAPKVKTKVDPALVAKARELRDRWMEQLNSCPPMLGEGKYDVARALPAVSTDSAPADRRALEAA